MFHFLLCETIDAASRLLVVGRIEQGGITVGLLKNDRWAGQVNVTEPGDFTVVLAAPSSGPYSLIIASDLPGGSLELSVELTRVGLLARPIGR